MQRKIWLWFFGLIILFGFGFFIFSKNVDKMSITDSGILKVRTDDQHYIDSVLLAVNYLANQTLENGKYVYSYNPINNKDGTGYNILRHAGTTYSILETYEVFKDKEVLLLAEDTLDYLVKQLVPCPKLSNAKCLIERDEIKLGGNGLAVLAMAKHAKVTGKNTYLEHAQKMAEWIISTQSEEGEFLAHKIDEKGLVSNFTSGYYPGEALFALARLYEVDGNRKWIDQAHKGANWIISTRDKNKPDINLEHDHWLLYALNELHQDATTEKYLNNEFAEKYLNHARKLTDVITKSQHRNLSGEEKDWNGGYYRPPRSTPTATRTEGLNAARSIFLRVGDKEYAKKAEQAIVAGIEFQLRTQMTEERMKKLNANLLSLGGFTSSLTQYDIRIDYVQHNISAILGYLITESEINS